MAGMNKAISRRKAGFNQQATPSTGTISIISPLGFTPPIVVTRIFLTMPRTGERTVRRVTEILASF
ncbi:hypothetical protein KCP71_12970 [Salmonella enterica subsp. enterica]|nr:hypothetical protein KCP71_12970 [Salmonella enterica subsp. enterica]